MSMTSRDYDLYDKSVMNREYTLSSVLREELARIKPTNITSDETLRLNHKPSNLAIKRPYTAIEEKNDYNSILSNYTLPTLIDTLIDNGYTVGRCTGNLSYYDDETREKVGHKWLEVELALAFFEANHNFTFKKIYCDLSNNIDYWMDQNNGTIITYNYSHPEEGYRVLVFADKKKLNDIKTMYDIGMYDFNTTEYIREYDSIWTLCTYDTLFNTLKSIGDFNGTEALCSTVNQSNVDGLDSLDSITPNYTDEDVRKIVESF